MILKGIALQYFRNYINEAFEFSKPITIIVGPNGAGKTSILEGIHLLSTGLSFRAKKIEEMIYFDKELARVKGKIKDFRDNENGVKRDSQLIELEIMLTRGLVQGKKTRKTHLMVNQVKRLRKNFVKHFYSVVFRPEDMRLIEGSPARRRSYLDSPLITLNYKYYSAHKTYQQVLRKRNKLLQLIRENKQPRTTLSYWTMQLIKNGEYLQKNRQLYVNHINQQEFALPFKLEYLPSVISSKRMEQYSDKEIIVGHTLIGPHKDDFIIRFGLVKDRSLAEYGSRGQQRLGVVWLKMAELSYLEKETGTKAVFLLDDVFSELDSKSREIVSDMMAKNQTIITTTSTRVVEFIKKKKIDLELISIPS